MAGGPRIQGDRFGYFAFGVGAHRRQNPEIETVCGDIAGFDGGRRRYDWVLADLSLHYWDDAKTRAIVAEIYKTLNSGGCFSVACKSVSDFEYGQGTEVGPDIFEHGHVRHFFRLEYLRELLQSFEIAKINECRKKRKALRALPGGGSGGLQTGIKKRLPDVLPLALADKNAMMKS